MLSPTTLSVQCHLHRSVTFRSETSSRILFNVLQDLLQTRNYFTTQCRNPITTPGASYTLEYNQLFDLHRCYHYNPLRKAFFHSSAYLLAKDYYDILGVPRSANDTAIKQAFLKKAKQYHPDLNKGNKEANQKFIEITQAYEILRDSSKRKEYDQYGGGNPQQYEQYQQRQQAYQQYQQHYGQAHQQQQRYQYYSRSSNTNTNTNTGKSSTQQKQQHQRGQYQHQSQPGDDPFEFFFRQFQAQHQKHNPSGYMDPNDFMRYYQQHYGDIFQEIEREFKGEGQFRGNMKSGPRKFSYTVYSSSSSNPFSSRAFERARSRTEQNPFGPLFEFLTRHDEEEDVHQRSEVIVNHLPRFFQIVLEPTQPLQLAHTKDTVAVRIYGAANGNHPHFVDYSEDMSCLANVVFNKTSEQTVQFGFNDNKIFATLTEEQTDPSSNRQLNSPIERYFTLKDNQNNAVLRVVLHHFSLLFLSCSKYDILDLPLGNILTTGFTFKFLWFERTWWFDPSWKNVLAIVNRKRFSSGDIRNRLSKYFYETEIKEGPSRQALIDPIILAMIHSMRMLRG